VFFGHFWGVLATHNLARTFFLGLFHEKSRLGFGQKIIKNDEKLIKRETQNMSKNYKFNKKLRFRQLT
jgi:hypothetical protein